MKSLGEGMRVAVKVCNNLIKPVNGEIHVFSRLQKILNLGGGNENVKLGSSVHKIF